MYIFKDTMKKFISEVMFLVIFLYLKGVKHPMYTYF